jgi:hypothetical protein
MKRALLLAVALVACTRGEEGPGDAGASGEAWLLSQQVDRRFSTIARHLRGLDVAMIEVGYRYSELHWAGVDKNWALARYQVDKIKLAMANAIERRPKRAINAKMLDAPLQNLGAAIDAADPTAFNTKLDVLTAACNACHAAENVAFFKVARPTARVSPLGGVQ